MIGKTLKGTCFGGAFAYLLSDEKVREEGARIIGGTVCDGPLADIVAEYEAIRLLAPRRKHVVYHQILSPPPGEGEALSDDTWLEIAADHVEAMGYRQGQWTAVRHDGHVHIVGNRVLLSGKVVSDSHDFARAERSVRAIEKKFGLTRVESSHLLEPERAKTHESAPSQAEIALSEKGEASVRELLQDQLLAVLDCDQTLPEFADRLYERGVLVRPNIQSTGRIAGLSFVLLARPDLAFSGSRLGGRFTWGNLQKDGVTYDPDRDSEGIERCLQRCAAPEQMPEASSEKPAQDLRPLADPRAARQHLEAVGVPVVLAARYRTGHVEKLAQVDHRSIGAWRRRLRRRSALGQEILIRPVDSTRYLVIPRCPRPAIATLQKEGINPEIVVEWAWKRCDVWIRTTGDRALVQKLPTALRRLGLPADGPQWGSLPGYRPDPKSAQSSAALQVWNRIVLIADATVDVSLDLLQRLSQLSAKRRKRVAPTSLAEKGGKVTEEKGRSR
jgi:hypothetical protein